MVSGSVADAPLTKGEVFHLRRLWCTAKSIYETEGGGLQSLGLLLNSLAVLQTKEQSDNGWAGQWTDRPGAKTKLTIPRLATDIGIAIVLLMNGRTNSPHLLQNYLVCDAALRLLLEVISRPMPISLQTEMRTQAHALLQLLQTCLTDFHDFCGAWVLAMSFINTSSSPLVVPEMEVLIENRLGVFCSPRFVVPLHEDLLPPDSILGCYHDAKMTGTALDADALQAMRSAKCIVDVAGSTAFATLHINSRSWIDGGFNTCIWQFTPCQTGGQSGKTKATVLQRIGGSHKPRAGALYNGRLWLTEFDGASPGDLAGYSVQIEEKSHVWIKKKPGPMKGYVGFSIVACGERFVIFGGLNSDDPIGNFGSMNGGVHYISAEDGYASDAYRRASTSAPGGIGPAARMNHAAWSEGKYMYIFGGISKEAPAKGVLFCGAKFDRLATLNDLWRLDTETWMWERLEPCGLRPCPRQRIGVANRGPDTYIVGGLAEVAPRKRPGKHDVLLLHDIWHYQAIEDCWVQVLPAKGSKAWMSARHSPACAVLDSGHLAVLGGFDAKGNPVGMNACLTFEVRHGGAMKALQAPMLQGFTAPDTAMLLALSFMEQRLDSGNNRSNKGKGVTNPRPTALLDSPAGAAVFLTRFPELLADAFIRPDNSLLEADLQRVPVLLGPALTLTADLRDLRLYMDDVFWSSGGCPFDTTPRWLGWPSEALVNHCTKPGTAWVTHMTQVVKSFGTAKAASEYFSLMQPSPRFTELFWRFMGCTLLPHAAEDLRFDEVEVYSRYTGPLGTIEAGQLYIACSMGRYFTCVHVALLSPKGVHFEEAAAHFLDLLHLLMADVVTRQSQPISCASCGNGDSLDESERSSAMKVCRGCRLVRYCSAECQAAAWPQHKEHCREYQRSQCDPRGDPLHPAAGDTSTPEPVGD